MITASHNPPEYNGIKLWGPDGASFTMEMGRAVEDCYFAEDRPLPEWQACGRLVPSEDFRLQYIEALLEQVNGQRLMKRQFQVAADCGGGAAAMVVPALLNAIEVRTKLLYCEPDGFFSNRLPEPKEANLQKLIQTVKKNELDVGMAWDGDADRIILITNQGRYLMGDRVFALAAYHSLRDLQEKPKRIVTQVATSDVIHEVALLVDAEIIETRVGEPFIVQAMKSKNAVIGGEENGGVIYRGWSWTREGMLTALKILELMELEDKSLEELDSQFSTYHQVKESVHCDLQEKDTLLELIKEYAPSEIECSTIDGIKVRYPDGWVLLRPSGTEPIFRVFAEAKTETRAKTLVNQGLQIVSDALGDMKTN